MKIAREAKIGIFAFIMLIVLYWGINFLNKNERLKSTNTYYAVYDNASGLQRKSPVIINGVSVGSVTAITLNRHNKVVVTLEVESKHKLPEGSMAAVSSGGILDKKNINLIFTTNDSYMQSGDTLRAVVGNDDIMSMMGPIAGKADSLVAQLNAIATAMQAMLSVQNQQNLTSSISSVAELSNNLSKATAELNKIASENHANFNTMVSELSTASSNLNSVSGNLKNSNEQITSLIKNADATMANTQALTATLDKYAAQGQLLNVMQNDSLYVNLNRTVKSLDALLVDLKKNPEDYVHLSVFGGSKKKK